MTSFVQVFSHKPDWTAFAPGRINLIGEHTDYHEGFVFPAAIDRGVRAQGRVSGSRWRVVSEGFGDSGPFDLSEVRDLPRWVRYCVGSALRFEDVPPLEIFVSSNLAAGAGLSSSAATEIACSLLFSAASCEAVPPAERARRCQWAENEVVGVPCGLMDQAASVLGVARKALRLDMRTLETQPVSIPAGWALVACRSGEQHELGDSGYPLRRRQSEEGARRLGVRVLRDATVEMAEALDADEVIRRRVRHVVSENARCLQMAEALEAGIAALTGRLMRESHESMRDDYEITTPLLDQMAEFGWNHPAVVGMRMTGGGFGGSCVAFVHREALPEFEAAFSARFPTSETLVLEPSAGASLTAEQRTLRGLRSARPPEPSPVSLRRSLAHGRLAPPRAPQ